MGGDIRESCSGVSTFRRSLKTPSAKNRPFPEDTLKLPAIPAIHTNPDTSTHTMAFLFSANSMAMVAPILTCAALRTHTRRAQHACAASRQSRHQTTHAAAAMRAATQPDCLAPTRLICAHPPAAHIHQPNRPRLARRA